MAALTKGVAYVDALPFLLVFAVWAIRALRWRAWRPFVALALLTLAINIGFFARNTHRVRRAAWVAYGDARLQQCGLYT